jgi:preprotein translocase subunit SecD
LVAFILFAIGTGPIKGFAVTLMIGIICSMFTAITVTRAIVQLIYGKKRNLKKLSI